MIYTVQKISDAICIKIRAAAKQMFNSASCTVCQADTSTTSLMSCVFFCSEGLAGLQLMVSYALK